MPNPAQRRFFLTRLATAALATAAGRAAAQTSTADRTLSFAHLHTGERLSVEYFQAGRYLPDALAAVNHLLRDFRSGAVGTIDPTLLDLLHELATRTGSVRPFEIISGYRSSDTNEMLRGRQAHSGVAQGSLHLSGRAVDIRLADVPLVRLRDAALALRGGGVGFYPGSDFVHVDTGRVRAW